MGAVNVWTIFTDGEGHSLTGTRCDDDDLNPGCVHLETRAGPVCASAEDLTQIAAALNEKAGEGQ
jgi:hypothetical protein